MTDEEDRPTAIKLILHPETMRQVRQSLAEMGKTRGEVDMSLVREQDPSALCLVIRAKDAPEPRLVDPKDFQ